jgi:CRP-like cAMP-binding protein
MRQGVEHRDLRKIWLFSGCSQTELRKVTRVLAEVTVPAGTLLVEEGQPGLLFFVVLSGRASVTRGRRTVSGLGPGDFFGELSLLDREPRSASVTSDTDMTLLVLRQHHFQKLLRATPTLTRTLLRAMADRLATADLLVHG